MKIWKKLFIGLTILLSFLVVDVKASAPPPPPGGPTGGGGPSGGDPWVPEGGGASIEGGLLILAVLGAGYAAKKWYDTRLETSESTENE